VEREAVRMAVKTMRYLDGITEKDWSIPMHELTQDELFVKEYEIIELLKTGAIYISNEFLDVCSGELIMELTKADRVISYARGKVYDFDGSTDGCLNSMAITERDFKNGETVLIGKIN
jgi:hypothetical protein